LEPFGRTGLRCSSRNRCRSRPTTRWSGPLARIDPEPPVEATVEEAHNTVEAPVSRSLTRAFSSGGGIWTRDLRVMSHGFADQAKSAKSLLRSCFWFASLCVLDHPIAPSRAMAARWSSLSRPDAEHCDGGTDLARDAFHMSDRVAGAPAIASEVGRTMLGALHANGVGSADPSRRVQRPWTTALGLGDIGK
jgi:hypothetical protein